MRNLLFSGLAFLLVILTQQTQAQVNCANDSTGLIPLEDLGAGYYLGTWQGGLYQGGNNTAPASHQNKGLQIVNKIKPLDSLGNVDWVNGKVVVAGFGASTVGGPFNHMILLMKSYNDLSPCLQAVNAANGADDISAMYIGNEPYWDYINNNRLGEKGVSPEQVQVAWLMQTSSIDANGDDIDSYVDSLVMRFKIALNAMYYYYPNLQVVFISGFPYGGYADSLKPLYPAIKEPSSYHQNFAMKELIRLQITGDPDLKYKGPAKKVPFLIWGPSLWADGKNPRGIDSLTWLCEEFEPSGGGYHLNNGGKEKFGNILLQFFRTNALTQGWFMNAPKWSSCGDGRYADGSIIAPDEQSFPERADVLIFPNPSTGSFGVDFEEVQTETLHVRVVNQTGATVFTEAFGGVQPYTFYQFNLTNQPAGMYYLELRVGDKIYAQPVVKNN